jgi:hypothetical protein
MGEDKRVYNVLVAKLEGKRSLRKLRCRWEDGIRMDFGEIGWREWSGLRWLTIGTGDRLL